MKTTFNLVAYYQYYENYAVDEEGYIDTANPYWKAKGGEDVLVKEGLSPNEVIELGTKGLAELAQSVNVPESNGGAEYEYLDYGLEELSDSAVAKARKAIEEDAFGEDYVKRDGYYFLKYALNVSEQYAKWLTEQVGYDPLPWYDRPQVAA